ncbi:MAG: ISNCY family transposase [Gammaproteobacteria bacterium]|nr:ISNCY family transposase [Gammaproteobacteria bacterium]
MGLQHLYRDPDTRKALLALLHELINEHETVRMFLEHSSISNHDQYRLQTVIDNVELLTPELLSEVNRLVAGSGHKAAGKKPGVPLPGRCDSFVVETGVHCAADVSLLWDATRCLIRETAKAAKAHDLKGWCQSDRLTRSVRQLFNRVRKTSQAKPDQAEACLNRRQELIERAESMLRILAGEFDRPKCVSAIDDYLYHARLHVDLVDRRLLKGENIPQSEKVFSICQPHARWISKGKAGTPVEFGVPVCILEDQHGFILHHEMMWQGTDVDYAVPMVEATQQYCLQLRGVSLDRGFHSVTSRRRPDELLDCNGLPEKGDSIQAGRQRESEEALVAQRRQHPAVESAIHNLEQRGLDRVRTHGAEGFARTAALSVLALNIHRIGLLLRRKQKKQPAPRRLAALIEIRLASRMAGTGEPCLEGFYF